MIGAVEPKGGTGSGAKLLDKLEFGGESPLTMRARCGDFRYCPDPLGIVTAKRFVKLEFDSITTALSHWQS